MTAALDNYCAETLFNYAISRLFNFTFGVFRCSNLCKCHTRMCRGEVVPKESYGKFYNTPFAILFFHFKKVRVAPVNFD